MKINVDEMKMGHLTNLIAQLYQTIKVMILLKSKDLIQQLWACNTQFTYEFYLNFATCARVRKGNFWFNVLTQISFQTPKVNNLKWYA